MADNPGGLEGYGDMLPGVSVVRSGSERLYPGSHELRPLALFRVESPLVPEGLVAVASFERGPLRDLPPSESPSPAQTLELLSELAAAISGQMKATKELLSKLGRAT